MHEDNAISTLWQYTELERPTYADVKPIVSIQSPFRRTYTLPNSQLQATTRLLDEGVHFQLSLVSGTFRKHWAKSDHDPRRLLPLFWSAEKYMLVIEAVMGLTGIHTALAHDVSCEGQSVDLILQPANLLSAPKFRLIVDIPADPSLLGTVTFFERFWITPTEKPMVRRRNAKHFASSATLVRFVQMKRL